MLNIVHLPIFIIGNIIKFLDEDVDRLCLSLTCKRLFQERQRYIFFNFNCNEDNTSVRNRYKTIDVENFDLKSYSNLLAFRKKQLYIGDDSDLSYDYIFDTLDDIDKQVADDVNEIIISDTINENIKSVKEYWVNNSNVTIFRFGDAYNHKIKGGYLPQSLKEVEFQGSFNQLLIDNSLPSTLERLSFGDKFNQPLNVVLSNLKSLRYLKLGQSYNCELYEGELPYSLEVLEFSRRSTLFNRNIRETILPQSLKQLINIPSNWLKQLNTLSLPNLFKISLHENINNYVRFMVCLDNIPTSVTDIDLGKSTYIITGTVGNQIRRLNLGGSGPESIDGHSILTKLTTNNSYNYLDLCQQPTRSFEYLNLGDFYNKPLRPSLWKQIITIKHLVLPHMFNGPLEVGDVPNGVEKLDLNQSFNGELIIPSSVKHLKFSLNYIRPIETIPPSIETLDMRRYAQTIINGIPPSVKTLKASDEFFEKNPLRKIPHTVSNIVIRYSKDNVYHLRRLSTHLENNYYLIFNFRDNCLKSCGIKSITSIRDLNK